MDDAQFATWRRLLDIAKANATIKGRREAMAAAGISCNLDDPFSGYYRLRRGKDGPFDAVAIWRDGDELLILWGGTEARLESVWPHAVWQPVSYDWYEAKMDRGEEWPDLHVMASIGDVEPPAPDEAVGPGHNQPPLGEVEALAVEIENAKAGVAEYARIESDEARDKAQSLRSRLLELSRTAKKRRLELNAPHETAVKETNALWMPLEKSAQQSADIIKAAQEDWATVKVQQRQAEQRRIDEENRKRQKEAEAAAAKAAAEKRPPPPPPPPVEAPPVAPAETSFRGGYGRASSEKAVEVVTGFADQDKTYQHFRDHGDVKALLLKLAGKILKDTGEVVPGVTTETRGKVA